MSHKSQKFMATKELNLV